MEGILEYDLPSCQLAVLSLAMQQGVDIRGIPLRQIDQVAKRESYVRPVELHDDHECFWLEAKRRQGYCPATDERDPLTVWQRAVRHSPR